MTKRIIYLLMLTILLWAGCSKTSVITERETAGTESDPDYTLIFYIHGDSDYLYHTADGERTQADQQALRKAVDVAEKAISGEVFIYHHQPRKRFLWMIPRRSSDLYHFRNGEIIHQVRYRHPSDEEFLKTESDLFNTYRPVPENEEHQTYFLYFGHEIPAKNYKGYHRSQPNIAVDTESFAHGAQSFLREDDHKFDLIVLSTCSNGTPFMARHLAGISNYLLASPQNLHLSYLDVTSLNLLESINQPSVEDIASAIAQETYDRLTENIQTVISLSVYDMQAIGEYLNRFYLQTLTYERAEDPNQFRENIDCAELSFFDHDEYTSGIETLFRPARFGHRSSNNKHSGWGCKGN